VEKQLVSKSERHLQASTLPKIERFRRRAKRTLIRFLRTQRFGLILVHRISRPLLAVTFILADAAGVGVGEREVTSWASKLVAVIGTTCFFFSGAPASTCRTVSEKKRQI
jgi:hypothetical protein